MEQIPSVPGTDRLRSVAFGAVLALSAFLPFELKAPLFHVGPLGITSVEISLYLACGAWAACRLSGRCRGWTRAHSTVAIWAALLLCSALLAPAGRTGAVKFALRSAGGCILCWAAMDLVRTPRRAAAVGFAVLTGACVSAAAARGEAWWPAVAAILGSFKTAPTLSGSYLRASGTFQYANIASMYWEAALPLAFALSARMTLRTGARRWLWAGAAASLLIMEAILLAASRAGIVIAILAAGLWLWLARGPLAHLRPFAAAGLIAGCLLAGVHAAADPLFQLRVRTGDPSSWYRAVYAGFPARLTVAAGAATRVPLRITNAGRMTWRSGGRQAAAVSYHWLDPSARRILIWNGARSELPFDVTPGAGVSVQPWVLAPREPGAYILEWDMLQEGIVWFSMFGPGTAHIEVRVVPAAASDRGASFDSQPAELPLRLQPGRLDLWRAAIRMWLGLPILGVGPDNFRHLYGPYLGMTSFDDRIYANNLYLEMLANCGLVGLAAWLAVLVTVAAGVRTAWRSAPLSESRLLVAAIGAALAAYYLHGMVDYFLAFTPTYGQFWILAGTALGLARGGDAR